MPPPGFPGGMDEQLKAAKPKDLQDVPRYLKEVVGGTAGRLLYIFKLVWEARRSLLLVMLFMTVYNGVMPLVGTLITANLLAKVVQSFSEPVNLLPPLCMQFGYTLLNSIVTNLSSIITNISGEIVSNHVKVKIMTKAREVDLASFDMPDFYARLENASREAGSRPVQILNSAFNLISHIISLISYVALLTQLLSRLDWKADVLFILFVGLNVLTAVVNFHFRRKNFFYMRFRSKDRRQMDYYSNLMTNKGVVKEIRLFNLSDLFIGRYKDIFKNYFAGIKKIIWSQGGWQMFLSLCSAGLNMSLFYLIATNVKLIADYSAYTASLNAISSGVGQVIQLSSQLYEGSLFIDNLILFMNEKKTIVPSVEAPVAPARHCGHTIELKNVSFAYPGTTRKVLKNLNLVINPGKPRCWWASTGRARPPSSSSSPAFTTPRRARSCWTAGTSGNTTWRSSTRSSASSSRTSANTPWRSVRTSPSATSSARSTITTCIRPPRNPAPTSSSKSFPRATTRPSCATSRTRAWS